MIPGEGFACLLSGIIDGDGALSPKAEGPLIQLESAIQDLLLSSIAVSDNQAPLSEKEQIVTNQLWMLCCRLWVRLVNMHECLRSSRET